MLFSHKLKKYFSVYLTVVALLISFTVGVAIGRASKIEAGQPELGWQIFDELGKGRPETIDFKLFWEAWKKINQSFIGEEKNDIAKRLYGAIKGMVDSLDDPYTVFMTPPEHQEFTEELEIKF